MNMRLAAGCVAVLLVSGCTNATEQVVLGWLAVCENLHQSLTGHTRHTRHTLRHVTNLQVTPLRHDFAGALMDAPGFRDEPECFIVDEYTVDETNWLDGFVTLPSDTD